MPVPDVLVPVPVVDDAPLLVVIVVIPLPVPVVPDVTPLVVTAVVEAALPVVVVIVAPVAGEDAPLLSPALDLWAASSEVAIDMASETARSAIDQYRNYVWLISGSHTPCSVEGLEQNELKRARAVLSCSEPAQFCRKQLPRRVGHQYLVQECIQDSTLTYRMPLKKSLSGTDTRHSLGWRRCSLLRATPVSIVYTLL